MPYDFTILSPDDFEELASDLLSRDWGVRLESFKPGKDKGIDLRNARTFAGSGVTVVQCKRYAPHKFAELLRAVRSEKPKVDKLRPAREFFKRFGMLHYFGDFEKDPTIGLP
jgi:hypothetical protein